jgi:hypothetical protein
LLTAWRSKTGEGNVVIGHGKGTAAFRQKPRGQPRNGHDHGHPGAGPAGVPHLGGQQRHGAAGDGELPAAPPSIITLSEAQIARIKG